jgi:hypothetical protein
MHQDRAEEQQRRSDAEHTIRACAEGLVRARKIADCQRPGNEQNREQAGVVTHWRDYLDPVAVSTRSDGLHSNGQLAAAPSSTLSPRNPGGRAQVPRRDPRSLGGHGPPPTGSCGEVATSSWVCADAAVLSSSAAAESASADSASDSTTSSTPLSRRCRFLTICGSKLPPRSRGTSISTGPTSVSTILDRTPSREFPFPAPAGRASHNPDGR